MNRVLAVAALTLGSLLTVACDGAPDTTGEQESDLDQASSCQWSGPANAKYKEAVAAAKAWGQQECEVLQTEVLGLAQEAVLKCPAIGPLIAESPYAGALRTALGPLEVAYLAGDLDAGDGSEGAFNSDAVTEALEGQTLWAPGQGAYGPPRIIHLKAGTYELERLVSDDGGETIERRVTGAGTWSVSADEGMSTILTFAPEEGTDELDFLVPLRLDRQTHWENTEIFLLVPADGSVDEYGTNGFYSANISECDA
jgi:hypothetical protein